MRQQSRDSTTKHPKNGTALDDLAVFVAVAEHESFVGASRKTKVTTSSVSRAVARLEEELGVVLLRRTSRRVTLTDEGRELLLRAGPHLEGLHDALTRAGDRRAEPSGRVRITAPVYTGATHVARAMTELVAAYPKIDIELDASNVLRDLVESGFDFGIRVGPVASPDHVVRRLWRSPFGLFATRPLAKKLLGPRGVVTRETLERGPCVALRASAKWRFRRPGGEIIEIAPRVTFAVNDPRAAVEVASRGLGIVLAPLDAVTGPPLVPLRTDFGEAEPLDLFVVFPSRRLLPQRVRLAIDWLCDERFGPAKIR